MTDSLAIDYPSAGILGGEILKGSSADIVVVCVLD
jgi:hypothetical protein